MAAIDDLRPYLQLLATLTEATVAKAAGAAQGVVSQGATTGSEATRRWEQMSEAGLDPDALAALVRDEVDRVARRIGFVREDELAVLRRQVERLEEELEQARQDAAAASIAAASAAQAASEASRATLAESVVESSRRIADVAGALESVTGLSGGPWGRVARDFAASAASMVASMGAPSAGTASAGKSRAGRTAAGDSPDATPPGAEAPGARSAGARSAGSKGTASKGTASKAAGAGKKTGAGKKAGKKDSGSKRAKESS
ncbi:MAG: hypothetical protein ACKOT0_07740 [bacterium]